MLLYSVNEDTLAMQDAGYVKEVKAKGVMVEAKPDIGTDTLGPLCSLVRMACDHVSGQYACAHDRPAQLILGGATHAQLT